MSREAMKLALEALEEINKLSIGENAICLPAEIDGAMDALRERLAQPEQEPVLETVYETIIQWDEGGGKRSRRELARRIVALYTAPTPRHWVGLTDEERNNLWREVVGWGDPSHDDEDLMQAIEAKLKEKNT